MATLDDHLPDYLDRLPNEIKSEVARYIAKLSDRKALVLVKKAWSGITLPYLRETFTTDLLQTGERVEMGLAHPNSNIIKHVRNIQLRSRNSASGPDLPVLLAAIPSGQLLGLSVLGTTKVLSLSKV